MLDRKERTPERELPELAHDRLQGGISSLEILGLVFESRKQRVRLLEQLVACLRGIELRIRIDGQRDRLQIRKRTDDRFQRLARFATSSDGFARATPQTIQAHRPRREV